MNKSTSFQKQRNKVLLAVSWFILVTVLLCIPGKKLPTIHWFGNLQLDKAVHMVLFFMLTMFICNTFYIYNRTQQYFWGIAFCCSLYGIGMEFIQENLIANRSFDVGDIVADVVGSFAFLIFLNLKPSFYNN